MPKLSDFYIQAAFCFASCGRKYFIWKSYWIFLHQFVLQ